MIEIKPRGVINSSISIPGSKSYTHRALIIAALCNTSCMLTDVLRSQDTDLTCLALKRLGISIFDRGKNILVIGSGGNLLPYDLPIYLGNSGTSMRLLAGVISLGKGSYTLVGNKRMNQRPLLHLVKAMRELKIKVFFLHNFGYPPIKVEGAQGITENVKNVKVDCSNSSQYLSSLLLISPFFKKGLTIMTKGELVSRPYIDITIDIMDKFGVYVERDEYKLFRIKGNQSYSASNYSIEPDCSHACYFWAAAAIIGGNVTVKGISFDSKQGDIKFLSVLEEMGCVVHSSKHGITVSGPASKSIDINMADMPDMVPTLAVVTSFIEGYSKIYGIRHLRGKESDRIKTTAEELRRMGVYVEIYDHKMVIRGTSNKHVGTTINSHNDHRIAMSFALAGLKVQGIKISNELCVSKSFPNFWDEFNKL